MVLWSPPDGHIYDDCNRRGEIQNGTHFVKQLHLCANGNCYTVCTEFFKQTFGLSRKLFYSLVQHSGTSMLPKEKFACDGSIKSSRERLVQQYISTIPRHYSHYSPTSNTLEYVQCASSCLNWWKGPLECDIHGSRPMCLLEWLDSSNETNNYEMYTTHNYFPGVHVLSDARPCSLITSTTSLPVPAIYYDFFLSVIKKCDLQFKDLSPDQCAKCMHFMSSIQNARPEEVAALQEAWSQHKKQADVGYLYRAARKIESKHMYVECYFVTITGTADVPSTSPTTILMESQ
jgi:hypothetical protein